MTESTRTIRITLIFTSKPEGIGQLTLNPLRRSNHGTLPTTNRRTKVHSFVRSVSSSFRTGQLSSRKRIKIWASLSAATSSIVNKLRQYGDLGNNTKGAIPLIRQWHQRCLLKHSTCGAENYVDYLPTRLIYLRHPRPVLYDSHQIQGCPP